MIRSYDVSFHLDENLAGWFLVCYEDDGEVFEAFFRDRADAEAMGHRFLDGCYVNCYPIEELV